ncbi:MAG: type II toxin-antitoxin system VapC family toxin [Limisphaerales bacterium]
MSAFADTSFLFAFYFPREASARAVEVVQSATEPVHITALVDFEFRQAVWFEVFLRRNGQPRGLSEVQAQTGLAAFELDCEQGIWTTVGLQLERLLATARELSFKHTARSGCRAFDLLHVAAALAYDARTFLSFDLTQCDLARAEGLVVPLVEPPGPKAA